MEINLLAVNTAIDADRVGEVAKDQISTINRIAKVGERLATTAMERQNAVAEFRL